ncbi:MAG TPA: hypothetical protein PLY86_11825 [bacterium]|nr:hypothetical protein [bacterium]
MHLSRPKMLFLSMSFLLVIFGAPITQSIIELARRERPQWIDILLQSPTASNLRRFENDLERLSWFSQKLQPVMRYLQFVVLKDAGEKAILGKNGWFFYKTGVRYLTEPWPPRGHSPQKYDDPLPAILRFRDDLLKRGIQLLVIPAPNKSSIYPEELTSRAENTSHPIYAHTIRVMDQLRANKVDMFDLFDLYSSRKSHLRCYLPQDTHWSPEGMHLAARTVAETLVNRGWITKGNNQFDLKPVTFARYGDILRMLSNPRIERRYSPEELHCTQVVRSQDGEPFSPTLNAEILVLGDSFLRIYEQDEPKSAGFTAHLAYELQRPIAAIISDGGASTVVRQQLSRKPDLLTNKKVVIWEFVERDIRYGLDGWKVIPLSQSPAI